jgi:hypothetical protein
VYIDRDDIYGAGYVAAFSVSRGANRVAHIQGLSREAPGDKLPQDRLRQLKRALYFHGFDWFTMEVKGQSFGPYPTT